MLPLCRSLQDLFGVQISYKLTQYWARNDFLCYMALLGVRGLRTVPTNAEVCLCGL